VISLKGAADFDAGAKLKATLEKNLPLVLALSGKIEGMVRVGANLTSSATASAVAELKPSCIIAIGAAAGAPSRRICQTPRTRSQASRPR
jgi:hypothetical protein